MPRAAGGISGSRVISVPLIRTVADRTVRRVRTSLLIDTTVASWRCRLIEKGGEHHGQVRVNRVMLAVEDRAGAQVPLAHPERLLDLPQV
jgi:hypothetical protein